MTTVAQVADQVQKLADIRGGSLINPIIFDLQHPTLGETFKFAGAINEPQSTGFPLNGLWVVLNGSSPHFKKVLKLKSIDPPNTSGVPNVISGLQQSWVEITVYDNLFADSQYYSNGAGTPGPQGPAGPAGYVIRGAYVGGTTYAQNDVVSHLGSSYYSLAGGNIGHTPASSPSFWGPVASKGDTPTVDYASIIDDVIEMLTPAPFSISLTGLPSLTNEGATYQLVVTTTMTDNSTRDDTATATYVLSNPSAGSVNSSGLFTAASVSADQNLTITAHLARPSLSDLTDAKSTTVRNKIPVSLSIAGPASVDEGDQADYVATVTYNFGSPVVLPSSSVTWGVSSGALGAINSAGHFTAAMVPSTQNGNITGSYTESGVTVNGNRAITVNDVAPVLHPKYGLGPSTSVGSYNSAFVNGLLGTMSGSGIAGQFTLNGGSPGSGQFMYYAYPKALGLAKFEDSASPGFFGGWDGASGDPINGPFGPVELSVTVSGDTQLWYLYRTDYDGLGSVTWNVSPQ